LEQPGLSFQHKAVQDFHTRQAQDAASASEQAVAIANPKTGPMELSIVDNTESVRSCEDDNGKLLF